MSKAQDESSPAGQADAQTAALTPPPVPTSAGDSESKLRDGAGARRVRAGIARERSGPIGISGGDFSTPSVRRRTATQPRGTPIVGVPRDLPDHPVSPEPVTFPATKTPALGATPIDLVEARLPARTPGPPPPPLDSPFGSTDPAVGDFDNAAAVLAAEAAAVRALDSGPLTPPPEAGVAPPALPREVALAPAMALPEDANAPTPRPVVALAAATPLPEVANASTPPPEVALAPAAPLPEHANASTPPPEVALAAATPLPDIANALTPPPEVAGLLPKAPPEDAIFSTLPPEGAIGSSLLPEDAVAPLTPPPPVPPTLSPEIAPPTPPPEVVAATPRSDLQATPPPLPRVTVSEFSNPATISAPEIAGAVPTRTMGSDGSAASGALPASTATAIAVVVAETENDMQAVDEIEVVEGKGGSLSDAAAPPVSELAATSRPNTPSPSSTRPPPPPIPGSYLKTPGPESPSAPPPVVDKGHGPLLPALPILPEALSLRPRRPKRSKPWFEEVFDEDYLRTLPFMRADQTLREVEFISSALQTDAGAEILDVGCGYGRHAIELVQRGYNVTGLDLSLPLLIRAADEAQRRALSVNFVHADMREMSFDKQFDGAYSMLTSFGYFDEETNLRVAERIGRALKPGHRFLLDVVNRDYVVADLPVRVWWEGTGCVVLEEVDFNFHTSRINTHRSIVFEDGRQLEQELSVRAYSLHEIGRLLRQAGFRVIDVSGGLATRGQFFGGASRSLLIVAEKRDEDA